MTKIRHTYQDDFEMLMVRHEYLSKVKNPDPKWFDQYKSVVYITAGKMFNKLKPNFSKVGYGLEDVKHITNCYMLGYMSLYSLERNEKARNKIIQSYLKNYGREPTEQELDKKERINLISFLRQRLHHASLICARKARNITVGTDKKAAYAFTSKSIPATDEMIFESGEELGYRKITKDELKDVKLKARAENLKDLVDKQGFKVIEIQFFNNGITEQDYKDIFISDMQDVYHNSPEDFYINKEKEKNMNLMTKQFEALSNKQKKQCLRKFIESTNSSSRYKLELKEARKMLKNL